MTVCIAAACRHEGHPALVLCCDERATRGTSVSSDDSDKVRRINDTLVVLLAGGRTAADELFWAINDAVKRWTGTDTDEIQITEFKHSLERAISDRKRGLIDRYTRLNLGLSFEEFLERGKTVLTETHYLETWSELRRINLGAELIVATFGQGEPVIMRISADAHVYWEDHFSTIGSGGPIAEAFLVQRPYHDTMNVSQCVARVLEAKYASERNRDVGPTTLLEIITFNEKTEPQRYVLTDAAFQAYESHIVGYLQERPIMVPFSGELLEPFNDNRSEGRI